MNTMTADKVLHVLGMTVDEERVTHHLENGIVLVDWFDVLRARPYLEELAANILTEAGKDASKYDLYHLMADTTNYRWSEEVSAYVPDLNTKMVLESAEQFAL